jgi:predicted ribosome quality control (RQC) complex YloA/Tae2 family protein
VPLGTLLFGREKREKKERKKEKKKRKKREKKGARLIFLMSSSILIVTGRTAAVMTTSIKVSQSITLP